MPHAIALKRNPAGASPFPAICAPLVGRTAAKLLEEVAAVAAKKPDILEWRVDFFEGIADAPAVAELAGRLKQLAGGIPILFTRRSSREGGEPISLTEDRVVGLYRSVCESGHVDLVDFEMGNDAGHVREVREFSRAAGIQLVLSFHDFQRTPPVESIVERFAQAQELGADVAKVAVMPQSMGDVLTLLAATLQASDRSRIPIISMSMGPLGGVTRVGGWTFGSAMTFAVGESSSAPGQMPIEDVAAGVAMLRRALGR
jgi:3-dehydroquinate dehydratase I